mgnify:CR=1 FL=1
MYSLQYWGMPADFTAFWASYSLTWVKFSGVYPPFYIF